MITWFKKVLENAAEVEMSRRWARTEKFCRQQSYA